MRVVSVPIFTYLPRWLFKTVREHDPYPPWQCARLLSWVGIRGAVSLVAALALPNNFPDRDLIVFLTFTVIVATLVIQGLTLPGLIRLLGLSDDGSADREDAKARIKAAEAALARLEELVAEGAVHPQTAERLRGPSASAGTASGLASTTTTTARSRSSRRRINVSCASSSTRSRPFC